MPLSFVAELIIEVVGRVVVEATWAAGQAAVDGVREQHAEAVQRARARALAAVDLLVIAAAHDHVVTEVERRQLADRLPRLLGNASAEVDLNELLQRWTEKLWPIASHEDLGGLIADTASILTAKERQKAFVAVCALLRADAIAGRPASGPFREAGSQSKADSARIFARALEIDDDVIEAEVARFV